MNLGKTARKLDNTASFLIGVEICLMLWNAGYGLYVNNQIYMSKGLISGMLVRLVIQGVLLIWLTTKEKNVPKASTVWFVFISTLFSGFTNIYSGLMYFSYGNIELLLVITSIVLLVRHYSYIKAAKQAREEKITG